MTDLPSIPPRPTVPSPDTTVPGSGPSVPGPRPPAEGVPGGLGDLSGRPEDPGPVEHRNDVRLVGRVVAAPSARALPDGEVITSWRLAVERPPERRRPPVEADAVTCAAGDLAVRGVARSFRLGDTVEVAGGLRRRAWRTVTGVANFYEVEVYQARIVSSSEGA